MNESTQWWGAKREEGLDKMRLTSVTHNANWLMLTVSIKVTETTSDYKLPSNKRNIVGKVQKKRGRLAPS